MVSIPYAVEEAQSQDSNPNALLHISLRQAQARIRALERQLAWEDELFANPYLSPGHKLTLRATVATVRKAGAAAGTPAKVYIPAIAEKVGLSAKTVGKNLQYLAEAGALVREAETDTDESGQRITRIFIGLTEQVKQPEQIKPAAPRNHGGYREHCPTCGSENLIEEKTVICTDCGTVIHKTQRLVNQEPTGEQLDYRSEAQDDQDEAAAPTDNLTDQNQKTPTDNLAAGYEKPPTPPPASAGIIPLDMSQEARGAPDTSVELQIAQEAARDLEQATLLLLDIAGDGQAHIAMNTNPAIPKKYVTVHRRLTLQDMRDHLQGRKTLGATLQHQDGTTRALCYDADHESAWQQLQSSAGVLIAEGYKPLLEPSPVGRGGHLWLIFSDRVNASAAYQQVCELAPILKEISEYWPGRGAQKVRLPAGKYVTPAFSNWTRLYDADRNEIIKIRSDFLFAHQTPADLIPPQPIIEENPAEQPQEKTAQPAREARRTYLTPDEHHRQKYGNHAMWVEWPDEQFLINRFNAAHTIDDLATRERTGMINASMIGRPERTASVGVTPDGERFTDFGAGARRPDGTQDGGDAFEFYIRSRRFDKAAVLRELGRELNRQASRELLRAARAGEPPPAWVMDIITPAGRAIYNENSARHGHPPMEADNGGVGGFSAGREQQVDVEALCMDGVQLILLSGTGELGQSARRAAEPSCPQDYEGDYPPPQRPCLHCKVAAWQWAGDKYICSNPGHPDV